MSKSSYANVTDWLSLSVSPNPERPYVGLSNTEYLSSAPMYNNKGSLGVVRLLGQILFKIKLSQCFSKEMDN